MPSPLAQIGVVALMVGLAAATLYPAFRSPPQDSFPFSNYPMFSHGKPERLRLPHVLGRRQDGVLVPIPPVMATGNHEVLQAKGVIEDALSVGQPDQLCREVAHRAESSPWASQFHEFVVATSDFRTVEYFDNGGKPLSRQIHASCPSKSAAR